MVDLSSGPVCMVALPLVLVFEVQTKSLVLVQDCIVDHMVLVWVHQEVRRIARVLDHHQIVDQVPKILSPIQVSLDTWVWVREVLHRVLDSQDHGMAWGAGREDRLRVRMHWEDHLVWTLGDHQGTCPLLSQGEALGRWETHHRHSHVDWVFSEPEGRVAGCPV